MMIICLKVASMVLVGDAKGKIAILIDDMADTCGTIVQVKTTKPFNFRNLFDVGWSEVVLLTLVFSCIGIIYNYRMWKYFSVWDSHPMDNWAFDIRPALPSKLTH